MNILIPMAGRGSRFSEDGYDVPKPMIPFLGKMMIEWAVDTLGIQGRHIFVIRKEHDEESGLGEFLKNRYPGSVVIPLDYVTEGAACTALLAEKYIDNDQELVITNCDQVLEWNAPAFQRFVSTDEKLDGAVVTYDSSKKINSFAWLDSVTGRVTAVREKTGTSHYSLNGVHYWKKGRDFVKSAKILVANSQTVNGEYYVSETYNPMIAEGKEIAVYHIPSTSHHAVGTPLDLSSYLRTKEK
jgi:NDP-sugar pyrophosphorylase family protein